jgi:hypothetical protein
MIFSAFSAVNFRKSALSQIHVRLWLLLRRNDLALSPYGKIFTIHQGAIIMTKTSPKKLSRRDAMKILAAAAGATTLANLPTQWSKPGLEVGVLPVHAQTSLAPTAQSTQTPQPSQTPPPTRTPTPAPILHTLAAGADQTVSLCFPTDISTTVIISPTDPGISMRYVITPSAGVTIFVPAVLAGTVPTDATGTASLTINAADPNGTGTITVLWSFANTSDGTGSGSQVFTSGGC